MWLGRAQGLKDRVKGWVLESQLTFDLTGAGMRAGMDGSSQDLSVQGAALGPGVYEDSITPESHLFQELG